MSDLQVPEGLPGSAKFSYEETENKTGTTTSTADKEAFEWSKEVKDDTREDLVYIHMRRTCVVLFVT